MKTQLGILIDNKYKILECLGEGGMSIVYRVEDTTIGKYAALKFMKEIVTSSFIEDKIRFKREVEVVSKLNHQNIVKVFEAGECDNNPYLVMELLEGKNLSRLLKEGKSFSTNDSLKIIKQLTEALIYVHGQGIIHRDLKPGNIFIKSDGSLKLLDFGIALIMELKELKDEKEVVGTFGFMSPEGTGILNKRVDERSDLYSVGIILYRLLTGELPFKADTVSKMIHQQVAFVPHKPSTINVNLPSILDEIVLKLLNKEPDLRYQSANGLLFDIEKCLDGQFEFIVGSKDQKIKLTYQTKLIGREEEVEKIKDLFDKATQKSGSFCLISGEAGFGKSRLVDEIRNYVHEKGGFFIGGRCLNQDNKIPYQPFKHIIDIYISYLNKLEESVKLSEIDRIKNKLGELAEIIIRFNPNMSKIIGKTKDLIPLDADRENQRFLMVLSDFFCDLFEKTCVLYLDDLQWIDEGSFNLLVEIASKIHNSNVLILGTYRNNEISEGHLIDKFIKISNEKIFPLCEICLTSFNFDKLNKFVANVIGEKEEMLYDITKFILDKTDGNPFFAINVLRQLVEEKALVWKNGQWEKDWDKIKKISIAKNIVDLILKRIKNLPNQLDHILCTCAVIGREIELDLLLNIFKYKKSATINFIDDAISLQLVEESSQKGKILFTHDRIRDAFCQKLSDETKCNIHKEITKTLEEMYKEDIDPVIFALAYHSVESKDSLRILKYSIPAAERAQRSYANKEAIKYYTLGIEMLEQNGLKYSAEWTKTYEGISDAYMTNGNYKEVIEISTELISLKKDVLQKARLLKKIGAAYFKMGNWTSCENNIEKGLLLLGVQIPKSKINVTFVLITEAIIHIFHCFFPELFLRKQVAVSEKDKEIIDFYLTLNRMYILTDLNKFICNVLKTVNIAETRIGKNKELGIAYALYGSLCMAVPLFKRSIRYQEKALEIRKKIGDVWGIAQSLQWLGFCYLWKGEYKQSIECFQMANENFNKTGDFWEIGMVLTGIGDANRYSGNYEDGLNCFTQYLEISRKANDFYGMSASYADISFCYREQGYFDKAEEFINKAISISQENKIWFVTCFSKTFHGCLALEKGEYKKAIEYLEYAQNLSEKENFLKEYSVDIYPSLAEAYIENYNVEYVKMGIEERNQEQKKIFAACKKSLKCTRNWVNHYGISLRAVAKYYEMVKNYKKAELFFTKSIEYTKVLNRRYEQAKSYFQYGNFLMYSGKIDASKVCCNEALKIFSQINSIEYKKKCQNLLGLDDEKTELSEATKTKHDRLNLDRRMSALIATGRDLSSILDLNELIEKVMNASIELIGAQRGALLLYSEDDSNILEQKLVRIVSNEEIPNESFTSNGIIEYVLDNKTPVIIENAITDKLFMSEESVIAQNLKSVICAPIMARGTMLGVIYLDNRMLSGLFNNEDLEILSLLASQAGVSLENAKLYKSAISDGFTGLYNRAFFDNTLMKYVAISKRYKSALSLIMIDIDYFKKFNDIYGHQAGDFVLKSVATTLTNSARESDIICRYGGEEFAIILPETNAEGAKILAERLRKRIENEKFIYSNNEEFQLNVTISIGVSELTDGIDRVMFIEYADKALYEAKASGKNRVCVFDQ